MSAETAHILKKKEGILSLEKFLDRKVVITQTSRELHGVLKGFDNNVNVVLADAEEWHKDALVRRLGACVVRGGQLTVTSSGDTVLLDKNPFQ